MIGYLEIIRQVIGLLFSLELTPVFSNRSKLTLITNIGSYCGLFDEAGVCSIVASMDCCLDAFGSYHTLNLVKIDSLD
jgi:hypothetical protein